MKRVLQFFSMTLLMILAPAIYAQPASCPQIVENVLQSMAQVCAETGRNQVCYGNLAIRAAFQSDAPDIQFEQVGDIAGLSAFQSLRLSPINGDTGEWGVALMRAQASVPNTIPGQNVTFVLFGDVEMTSALGSGSSASPMQAFYFSTGVGMIGCEEAPPSGLLVQTPTGAGQIEFSMNGMDISLGSAAFIRVQPGEAMQVSMLDGAGALQIGDQVIPALAGTTVTLPLGDDLLVEETFEITAFDAEIVETLPLDFLDASNFELADALDDDALAGLLANLEAGLPICGEGTLWDCAELPWLLGGELCALDEDGNPDCELQGFRWGDEDFGSSAFGGLNAPPSGVFIQPRDGQWTQTDISITGSNDCPAQMLSVIENNTGVFPSEPVVFPKPFDFEEFLRSTPDALPPDVEATNPQLNVYQLDFSQEGVLGIYTMEVLSETEVSAQFEIDMTGAGLDCVMLWEASGIHTGD